MFIEAGRIGSGRFDRGERDDRQRGDAPGTMKGSCLATRELCSMECIASCRALTQS